MTDTSPKLPLAGLKVVELGHYIAGVLAAVNRAGLEDGISRYGVIAVGQHMIVGQDEQLAGGAVR